MINFSSKLCIVMPCAGAGSRAGSSLPKQYAPLAGVPVMCHALKALSQVKSVQATVVVISPDDELYSKYVPAGFSTNTVYVARVGGATRAESVRAGLKELRLLGAIDHDWVLVHDAVRCLVLPQWVEELINACADDEVGGLLAQPVPDTLKQAEGKRSVQTVPRHDKWLAQTPQMFRLELLEQALDKAQAKALEMTDEASAIEAMGLFPKLVPCSADNFKLTYPQDFERAEAVLYMRALRQHGKPWVE